MYRASELYNLGRYQDALQEYTKQLQSDPDDVAAVTMIANCNTALGNHAEALRMAKTAVAMDPTYDFVHRTAGVAHQNLGHKKEAEVHYREAVRLNPENYRNHTYLGSYLTQVSKCDEAIRHLEEARRLEPNEPEPLRDLSLAYSEKGDFEKSLQLAIEALKLDPDESDSHLAIGLSQLAKGDNVSAEKHISEALRIKPHNPGAENALREAIRCKLPIYRSLMKQSRWIRSKGRFFQTAVWFGGYLLIRGVGRVLMEDPSTRTLGIAMVAAWTLMVVYSTVTPVIANIALLRHPLGRFALKKPQRIASFIVLGFVGFWISLALVALATRGTEPAAIVTIFGLLFTVGASIIYSAREDNADVHTISGIACGFGAILCTLFYFGNG